MLPRGIAGGGVWFRIGEEDFFDFFFHAFSSHERVERGKLIGERLFDLGRDEGDWRIRW
jgi:hypothetical protein